MNQVSWAAGLERPEVQFTLTVSPIWYLGCPPVIRGPSTGSAAKVNYFLLTIITYSIEQEPLKSFDHPLIRVSLSNSILVTSIFN